jgi:hypothetical protein
MDIYMYVYDNNDNNNSNTNRQTRHLGSFFLFWQPTSRNTFPIIIIGHRQVELNEEHLPFKYHSKFIEWIRD